MAVLVFFKCWKKNLFQICKYIANVCIIKIVEFFFKKKQLEPFNDFFCETNKDTHFNHWLLTTPTIAGRMVRS